MHEHKSLSGISRKSAGLMAILMLFSPAGFAVGPSSGVYNLADFGPVETAAEAQATLESALQEIVAQGGGVLSLGPGAASDWRVDENTAPSSTKRNAASVTILDRRRGYLSCLLPSNVGHTGTMNWLGLRFSRSVREPIDMCYGVHSSLGIETHIAGGTSSYLHRILEDVEAGEDRRIYVPTIRGLAEGNHIVLYNPNDFTVIKSLGWDRDRQLPYIVADLRHDHAAGGVYQMGIGNKHVVNSLTITDNVQSDNQSMTVLANRNVYADGDGFVFSARIRNQANIMSSLGDEGALCYAADIQNDLRPFRSTVESWNPQASELVYAPGVTRNFTLGTSRPLINMNPDKHVTAGAVYVVAPGHRDPWDPSDAGKTGQGYQGEIFPGGAIIGLPECGWTQDVVGRFFAIDEPTEYLDPENDPSSGYTEGPDIRVHRWYHIRKLERRADGSHRLYVERTRWLCSVNNVPLLYRRSNYSDTLGSQPRLVPLQYIIAPGAYVADVSRAWTDSRSSAGRVSAAEPRTLVLAPSPDTGGKFDFEQGDRVVQAIGQDPWSPTGVRVRHHNYLPSTLEDSSFQAVNYGRVSVHSALQIHGGGRDLDATRERNKDRRPAFRTGIDVNATTAVGLCFKADVAEAAIRFDQPNGRPQPLVWLRNKPNARSTLTVDPESGDFRFSGGILRGSGLVLAGGTGISAGETPARNLRGIRIPVPAGAAKIEVRFPAPEADGDYAVMIQPSWFTMDRIAAQDSGGFVGEFSEPAPEHAYIHWTMIR